MVNIPSSEGLNDEVRQELGRLGDIGWHPLDDDGEEDAIARFARLPLLVQRALIRLAYTIIDSSPQETKDADFILGGLMEGEIKTPFWESPKRQLQALQQVRGAVAAQIIINRFAR